MNADLFGYAPPVAPFVDIRNQRESVAEEKARLCLELNALCRVPPKSLNGASINRVREWRITHKAAAKTLSNKQSSRQALMSAITSMRSFESVA